MCALTRDPRLLVADELSLGLAPAAIERLVGALRRVREIGTVTVVIAEQNTTVALACSDWVVAIGSHRVRAQGPPSTELEERLRHAYVGSDDQTRMPTL
jgi:branched-chain amino acid transport system ATP-binding protein